LQRGIASDQAREEAVMKNRLLLSGLMAVSGVAVLGGCVYRERVVPAASVPAPVVVAPAASERVVTYPEGRYELRGEGSATSPYYWVWIPAGAPPPPPRRGNTQ
jgi:hypothetical protein